MSSLSPSMLEDLVDVPPIATCASPVSPATLEDLDDVPPIARRDTCAT